MTLSTRTKRTCTVLGVQVLCVAVGVWMHHNFTYRTARTGLQQSVWSDLASEVTRLFNKTSIDDTEKLLAGEQTAEFASFKNGRPENDENLTIVDDEWHPTASTLAALTPNRSTTTLQWTPAEDVRQPGGRIGYGHVRFPDGLHTAARYELPHGGGYALLHVNDQVIDQRLQQVLGSLPVISLLTVVWTCALLGFSVYMILARLYDEMDQHRSRSAADTLRQTHDLLRTRDAVIFGLAKLADSRDPETGDHLERISIYSTTLAAALRRHPKFHKDVTPGFVRLIGISAALHDIGKVGVEDSILRKPGKLTEAEHATMQLHTRIGGDCLKEIEHRLGGSNFLQMAREIAYAHHENWDGSGYPVGLSSEQIPLAARIVAIADVYDALSSKRIYKDSMTHEECLKVIRDNAGRKFDPDMVEVWLSIESKFRLIAQQLANQFDDVDHDGDSESQTKTGPATSKKMDGLLAAASGETGLR